jgi:hypothetical protein
MKRRRRRRKKRKKRRRRRRRRRKEVPADRSRPWHRCHVSDVPDVPATVDASSPARPCHWYALPFPSPSFVASISSSSDTSSS